MRRGRGVRAGFRDGIEPETNGAALLTHFTPPRRIAWEWACPSAGRSRRLMKAACGPNPMMAWRYLSVHAADERRLTPLSFGLGRDPESIV
jgi:hypothetical protein